MTITKKAPRLSDYDWTPLLEAAIQNPGEWICEDAEERPKTTPAQLRAGTNTMVPGAFDAVVRRKEGLFLRFLGVPITPLEPWEVTADTFPTIERTLDFVEMPKLPAAFERLILLNLPGIRPEVREFAQTALDLLNH